MCKESSLVKDGMGKVITICKGDRLKCKEWEMEYGIDVTREHELIGTRGTTFLSSISTNL